MSHQQKVEAAIKRMGAKYVFHPTNRIDLTKARRQDMSVLVLALAARLKR
jgi:hypothetical protein